MQLDPEQVAFFKDNGYLILPGMMDLSLCEHARQTLWDSLPGDTDIKRDEPATHFGPFSDHDAFNDATHMRQGYRWQLRSIGTQQEMIDLVYGPLRSVAEQLLGGQLQCPVVGGTPMGSRGPAWPDGPVDPALGTQGIRGIYCTLPHSGDVPKPEGAHTDGHPFMLGMVGLISDSPPGGGAFMVWPKSHRRLYPTFWMQYDQARVPFYDHMPSHKGLLNPPAYHEERTRILGDTQAVDCWGSAGDVVLWHHRLLHAAAPNGSGMMRQAVLADFSKTDLDRMRMDPPQDDMWRDWSGTIRHSPTEYSQEFAGAQRLAA